LCLGLSSNSRLFGNWLLFLTLIGLLLGGRLGSRLGAFLGSRLNLF
jgi:hypothetical protein